jgi:hypothetical protein
LLLFSDGLYEVPARDGSIMGFDQFVDLLQGNGAGPSIDLDKILDEMRRASNGAGFSDDTSILRLDFADVESLGCVKLRELALRDPGDAPKPARRISLKERLCETVPERPANL